MSRKVAVGLDNLSRKNDIQSSVKGNIGYLCHSASIDCDYTHGIFLLKKIFGDRLKKIFSPQHGFVSDVQDNMIESDHYQHPYFNLPIFSLYSETRIPTDEMLEGLDSIVVDLQDVGTRIYTYIYTMTLLMSACAKKDIKVIILDRPNPIGGEAIEGNILEPEFKSFVGLHPLPVRHGLTIAEVALMAKKFWGIDCQLQVVKMVGWERWMDFEETAIPWVLPSPNLPNVETAFTFVGTVLYEGTNISEGRGTTKSLETLGHPKIEPYQLLDKILPYFKKDNLEGFVLRPIVFQPTFQKHAGIACGGFHIHITDRKKFTPWKVGQILCREFYKELGEKFSWKEPPYEYEFEKLPIDLINGSDKIRQWVEQDGSLEELKILENKHLDLFLQQRNEILLYN
ncbi:DUF1343 domain-containing protein [Fulvivirgaceae bacterium BMA10]|uniref:DUF1343 domain-containing protein n=1 Tax=Splendidivirga corallicola TaxID=3051826 RepID=A0ABT8KKR1_9BACT|nr:DUF1343 domain-containing protein [Fulvivirgaceae bacterium BMA10]